MKNSSNDIFIMIVSVTIVVLILVVFIVSFLLIYQNRQLKHRVEMETVKEKFSNELLQTQLEIKEQTLKTISEEIHDNVGQVLSLVILNLSSMELDGHPGASVKIETSTRLVEKAVSDLRNLSKTMDAERITSAGLIPIIQFELELIEKTGVYKTELKISGEERRLDGQKELILYRIIQEALNNIIKHAKASRINITLAFQPEQVGIEIVDDGVGFDTEKKLNEQVGKRGAGLSNMKRRMMLIGGSAEVQSSSAGTTVYIALPPATITNNNIIYGKG